MLVRFIGDVHGKFQRYKTLIKDVPVSRQCGDFGVGFKYRHRDGEIKYAENPPFEAICKGDHKFVRGNHDNPYVCSQQHYWCPDGSIEHFGESKVMYVGGGVSIDKAWRTEGFDYWEDEELSYHKLQEFIDLFSVEKPDVMVSHECPDSLASIMEQVSGRRKLDFKSRTREAFDAMLMLHKPKLHIYGHWHRDFDYIHEGTRYICLNELSYVDVSFEGDKINILKP